MPNHGEAHRVARYAAITGHKDFVREMLAVEKDKDVKKTLQDLLPKGDEPLSRLRCSDTTGGTDPAPQLGNVPGQSRIHFGYAEDA